ncbi:uncharacterized protein PHACADRAFT_90412, partial [Phanerochaete carnosa HHB-10118-sp]
TALIFYDHLITLDQEIRTVWRRKFSIVSLLIVFTRWTLIIQATFTFIMAQGLIVSHSVSCATQPLVVFSALRVCAIWNQNYVLFIIVLVLGLTPVITNAVCTILFQTSRPSLNLTPTSLQVWLSPRIHRIFAPTN